MSDADYFERHCDELRARLAYESHVRLTYRNALLARFASDGMTPADAMRALHALHDPDDCATCSAESAKGGGDCG